MTNGFKKKIKVIYRGWPTSTTPTPFHHSSHQETMVILIVILKHRETTTLSLTTSLLQYQYISLVCEHLHNTNNDIQHITKLSSLLSLQYVFIIVSPVHTFIQTSATSRALLLELLLGRVTAGMKHVYHSIRIQMNPLWTQNHPVTIQTLRVHHLSKYSNSIMNTYHKNIINTV